MESVARWASVVPRSTSDARSTRGGGSSELWRMRQLEEENRKLKQIVADLSLGKAMLQHLTSKNT